MQKMQDRTVKDRNEMDWKVAFVALMDTDGFDFAFHELNADQCKYFKLMHQIVVRFAGKLCAFCNAVCVALCL